MNAKPKIIDLTKKFGTAETLTEARVSCSLEEKVCFAPMWRKNEIIHLNHIFRTYIYTIF